MVKMAIMVLVGLLLVGGIGIISNVVENVENNKLEIDKEYTPSQNLAIYEGRFDDARDSIQEDRDKW